MAVPESAALEAVLALHRPYILTSRTAACRLADSVDDDHEDDESCFEEITVCNGCGVEFTRCSTRAAIKCHQPESPGGTSEMATE